MAATSEKQSKAGFMSLYNKPAAATGTYRIQLPEPKKPSSDKNYISRSWLLMRKPKGVRSGQDQVDQGGERVIGQVGGGGDGGGNVGGGSGGREVVAVEGRKSVSHVETNLASVIAFLQVKVLLSDMPSYMQVHAFRCARRTYDSLEKFSAKHMAYNMKKEFDKVHGPAWHCIVGSSFGSFVTHSTGCFLYFSMEKLYILLFKTKIQKAVDS
ncbi:Dynein light chain [Parasponia andersonii]|uniref:Dynein light chain n=1 Tax=Parasponia andersonii TaxID=3476 RepID=A0A2P5DYR1_PARAD|nr:Dynein light chain [Parasponia andersonii]